MNRFLLAAAALLLATAPAHANQLRQSATTFCTAVRKINAQGLSAAPGTYAGSMIAANANQSDSTYIAVWQTAKAINIPACRAMW